MLLHPDDIKNYEFAKQVATYLARSEGLRMLAFEPKRRPSYGTSGICYCEERRISIVFRWKQSARDGGAWLKRPIPFPEVLDTVAHEIAHLRYPNHGKDFQALYKKLLGKLTSPIDNT